MSFLVVASSLLPIWLAGDFALTHIFRGSRSTVERFPLAFALGCGITASTLLYLSWFNSKVALPLTIIIMVTIALAHIWLERARWFSARLETQLSVSNEPLALALVAVFVAIAAGLVVVTLSTDLGFDGLITWAFKGKIAFLEGGFQTSYFANSVQAISHPDYPVLLPSVEAWAYSLLGRIDEKAIKMIFPVFYFALLALFWSALDRGWSLAYRWLFLLLFATIPYFSSLAAVSGYADMPLMLYIFSSSVLLRRWMQQGRAEDLWLGATLSAFSVWVKREGIVYWAFNLVMACFYIFLIRRNKSRRVQLSWLTQFLIPPLLIVVPWFAFLGYYQVPNSDFAMDTLPDWSRLFVIADYLVKMWLDLARWGGLWIIFFVALIWNSRARQGFPDTYLVLCVIVPLTVLSLSFTLSLWVPFTKHIDLSLERLCMDEVPFAMWFIALRTAGLDQWLKQLQVRRG